MTRVDDNVRVFGDVGSEVYLGPVGTTLPTDLISALNAALIGFGWLSEDGVSLDVAADVKKFKGLGGQVIRTKVTSTDRTVKFQALEDKPDTAQLFWGAGAPTVTGTAPNKVAKLDLPGMLPTVQRALVIKQVDLAGVTEYLCCTKAEITERGTLAYKADEMKIYEYTAQLLGTTYILTNAVSFTG